MGNPDLKSHLYFQIMTEHIRNEKGRALLYPRTGGSTTSHDGTAFYNDKEMELYVGCCSGHSRPVQIESIGRPRFTEQQDYQQQEPDCDLPSSTLHERNHPARSNKQHADHGTTRPKYGMRRPEPKSVEQERKIKPFDKKPITFMFHATYNDQIYNILEQGIKPGKKLDPTRANPCSSCKH